MTERQTTRYLMKRFEEAGIFPRTRFGQNFLTDLNILDLLADSADVQGNDVVLEVGTGTAALTSLLSPRAFAIVTVEIDHTLAALAREQLIDFENVTLLERDALRNKNRMHDEVLDTIRARLADVPGDGRFKLVANLPYNVATPIISNLLSVDPMPVSMTVTIQKELADRIMAKPSTKDYSALSIWIQSQCETELIRVLPPSVFWPRPKVHSAIIHIRPVASRRERLQNPEFFHEFTRSMFFHRRKYLRSVAVAAFKISGSLPLSVLNCNALSAKSRASS